MLPATLATDVRDAGTRLAAIHAAMGALKSTTAELKGLIPTDFPSLGAPWLFGGLTKLFERTRLADRIPLPANLVVSNVPGPPVPLYLAGAKMLTNYPASIVVHGVALNITVQSYDRHLDFGLMADAQALPDVRELADAVAVACADLQALLRAEDTVPSATDLVGRAARGIGQAVSDTVGGMVGGAVRSAVSGVVGGVVKGAVGRATRPAARKR
jgi:hypothetical protein